MHQASPLCLRKSHQPVLDWDVPLDLHRARALRQERALARPRQIRTANAAQAKKRKYVIRAGKCKGSRAKPSKGRPSS